MNVLHYSLDKGMFNILSTPVFRTGNIVKCKIDVSTTAPSTGVFGDVPAGFIFIWSFKILNDGVEAAEYFNTDIYSVVDFEMLTEEEIRQALEDSSKKVNRLLIQESKNHGIDISACEILEEKKQQVINKLHPSSTKDDL